MDTYKDPIVINFPGMIARIHRPNISTEERERRMKRIHNAAENLLKEKKQCG